MARSEHSPTTRNVLRVVGVLLLLAGIFFAVRGGLAIADAMPSDEEFFAGDSPSPGFGEFAQLAGGLFLFVFGLGALNAGFLGVQSRYAAGETSGAVREFGSAFRGEEHPSTVAAGTARGAEGPFCSECGVRNDQDAKFCDSCGHALVRA